MSICQPHLLYYPSMLTAALNTYFYSWPSVLTFLTVWHRSLLSDWSGFRSRPIVWRRCRSTCCKMTMLSYPGKHDTNGDSMFAHRLWRWPNIKSPLVQRPVLLGCVPGTQIEIGQAPQQQYTPTLCWINYGRLCTMLVQHNDYTRIPYSQCL